MDDLKTDLRRAAKHYPAAPDALSRMRAARERRHRNQRIGAAVAGLSVVTVLVAVLTAIVLQRGSIIPAAGGRTNGPISFSLRQGPNATITAVQSDGSGSRQLTTGVARFPLGSWSPDGSTLLYTPYPEATSLRAIGADGSDDRLLYDGEISDAAWSPDGSRVAFVATFPREPSIDYTADGNFAGRPTAIFVVRADGSRLQQLTEKEAHYRSVSWAPDSGQIYYVKMSPADSGLETLRVPPDEGSGGAQAVVPGDVLGAALSPDGGSLVYMTGSTEAAKWGYADGGLFVANPDGTAGRAIPLPGGLEPGNITFPRWSSDGQSLLFQGNADQVWVMGKDGSDPKMLASRSDDFSEPAWSPDGTQVAYQYEQDIWTVSTDGSAPTRLTHTPSVEVFPAWGTATEAAPVPPSSTGRILVSAAGASGSQVLSIDPDTGHRQVLSIEGAYRAESSPDGTQIVYDQDDSSWPDGPIVVVADADGSNPQTLASGVFPDWSPKGEMIAFDDAGGGIGIVAPDGTGERHVIDEGTEPRWLPDGSGFTYRTSDAIMLWTPDGTRKIADAPGIASGPEMSPDDSTIVYARATPGEFD